MNHKTCNIWWPRWLWRLWMRLRGWERRVSLDVSGECHFTVCTTWYKDGVVLFEEVRTFPVL